MELEKQQNSSGPKCPDHPNAEVKIEIKEIKTGYTNYVRKVMLIGKCQHEGCTRWCDINLDYVIWN